MSAVIRGRWCSAKANGDFICIWTQSGYHGGTDRDPKGVERILEPDATDQALGAAMLDALAHSRFVLPAPREGAVYPPDVEFDMDICDYKQSMARHVVWENKIKERYGYKTKRALYKSMKSCQVEARDGSMTIMPWHHEVLERWTPLGKEANVILPANSSAAELGAALRLAFSRCT